MATTWTPERRRLEAERIRQRRPWERSTGPRSVEGKAKVARNAYRGDHGKLARELARALREQRRMLKQL